jgi:hypothetical protein
MKFKKLNWDLKGAILLLSFWFSMFLKAELCAQTNLGFSYYDFDVASRNLVLWASKTYQEKHVWSVGLKYHFNDPLGADQTKGSYYRTIQVDKWYQQMGVMAGYERKLKWKNNFLEPFLWYNFQFTYGNVRNYYDVINIITKVRTIELITFGPKYFFENQIGVGCHLKLTDRIRCHLNAGVGLAFIWDFDPQYEPINRFGMRSTTRDPDRMFAAGIQYELITSKKNEK